MSAHDNGAYVKPSIDWDSIIPVLSVRQDSLTDQLNDLIRVANRLGMYDASDWLGVKRRDLLKAGAMHDNADYGKLQAVARAIAECYAPGASVWWLHPGPHKARENAEREAAAAIRAMEAHDAA